MSPNTAKELTESAIRQHLHTSCFGNVLYVEPRLPSTNTTARSLADAGTAEGTVVVAREQSAGRGTRSRSFFSPQGGVYLSLVLRPHPQDVPLITSCAAVAVARAIERCCPLTVHIKWVNDLYINGKKVCGILTEAGLNPATHLPDYIILGIGVNVAVTAFPPEIATIATSLADEGCAIDRASLIAAILEEWEHAYATIGTRAFLEESRRRSCVLGKRLTISQGNANYTATAEAITNDGHLTVRTLFGDTRTLCSGEVSIHLE